MAWLPKRRREDRQYPDVSLRDEVNRVFDEFFGRSGLASPFEQDWMPAVDVSETADTIEVKAEIPGVDAKDIDISLTGDTLTIKGEKREEEKKEEENYMRVERRYGGFRRMVSLPASVDPAKVNAKCKDGVLRITMEKKEETKAKPIDIKVE